MEDRALASRIEHTLLDAAATAADLERLCDQAWGAGFVAVCVNPAWVRRCAARLAGGPVGIAAVVGFPLGANLTEVKALEAARAVEQGASEVDMMMFLGALRSGEHVAVARDIVRVVEAAAPARVKVVLETSKLTDDEKRAGARLAVEAGAAFVKTSTGCSAGATVEDVRLLRSVVGPNVGVKASGGIRTREQALALLAAGASRLGTSAGLAILRGDAARRGDGP